MLKKCIICLKDKEDSAFNEEHIFPAAIGGTITIPLVCQPCNSSLGQKVDDPFCNNNLILHYRNVLGISRPGSYGTTRERTIKNPFKGLFEDQNGGQFRIKYKDGVPTPVPIPKVRMEYSEEHMALIGRMDLPMEDLPRLDTIVREAARRKGFHIDSYSIQQHKVERPDKLRVTFNFENNTLILGCVKMAYEITCSVFPTYVNDPVAFMIRASLKKGKVAYHLEKLLKNNHRLQDYFTAKFSRVPGLRETHHGIMMEVVNGYGLVCCVRFFNQVYPVTVSTTFTPIKDGYELFIYNDSLTGAGGSNVTQDFPTIQVSMELEGITEEVKKSILSQQEDYFTHANSKIPVFDRHGSLLHEDLDVVCNALTKAESRANFFVQPNLRYNISEADYYLKAPGGSLVKINAITPERRVSLKKIYAA